MTTCGCSSSAAGPQRDDLERFARLASDLEHIRFLGPRADVANILPHCDAVWHNGELPGEPAAVLEALAAGTPVIVGSAPGREEMLADGGGVIVAPDGRADWARKTDEWFCEPNLYATLRDASARFRRNWPTKRTRKLHRDLTAVRGA